MNSRFVFGWATTMVLAWTAATGLTGPASAAGPQGFSQNAPIGLTLEQSKETLTSALRVDLTRDYATLPLYRGTVQGLTVWYVITDVSDAGIARRLGVNHAPKLVNAPRDCPACVQEVTTANPLLGRAPVEFQGAPDFSPTRTIVPGPDPTPFPPQAFTVGAQGGANYTPYVRVIGRETVVYNAPIVATGDGPFDVTTHSDTHDRTIGIDTIRMTADLLFVRAFANGEPVFYLSFESSDAFTATLERITFVPALHDLAFQNGGGDPDSARASIFTFVNAQAGLETNPGPRGATDGPGRSQGLTHALSFDIATRDAAVANPEVLEALRRGADVSNILDVSPTNILPRDRREYSPAWDLNVGVYSDEAVAQGLNGLQTDANDVRRLAAQGLVTAPGGLPLSSSNVDINCPVLAFPDTPPLGPRFPPSGSRP